MNLELTQRGAVAVRLAIGIALVCLSTSCDGLQTSPPIPSTCSRIGAQCQLPGGPLGVCQETPCDEGVAAPCFACTPQH
ncbi:MAG: hypothetical protein FJ144_28065 [Deltaproteobacteria bacterium]|nr:hypothetical protein [Deltaproteobacteria bacterium]